VSIDARRLSSVAGALAACRRILSRGRRLLVFPEGTRARSGRLQAFHPLAFELALGAGVSVAPVIIHSTVPFMAKVPGSLFPRQRNEYRIRFLDPETARPEDTAESLCDRVHRRMALELKTLDAGTVWENEDRS
jgi:1-acyl-sn-glycerol-3-phosphate acyltransferase